MCKNWLIGLCHDILALMLLKLNNLLLRNTYTQTIGMTQKWGAIFSCSVSSAFVFWQNWSGRSWSFNISLFPSKIFGFGLACDDGRADCLCNGSINYLPHYPMRQYTEHTKLFSQKQLMVLSKHKRQCIAMYRTIQTISWVTPFYTEQILQTKFCSFLQSLISLKRPILAHEGIFLHGNWFLSFKDI